MVSKKQFEWYNISKVMSYQCMMNFIIGARGLGKTYGFKKFAIDNALKKGHQFIYLRRYETELKGISQFFVDVNELYPEWDFRIESRTFYAAPASTREDKKREWKVIGFYRALSKAQNDKSVPFDDVRNILFDEFIIEKGRRTYLPDEVAAFLGYYSTVDRNQDKTRVFFMANAVKINNPYFPAFGIHVDGRELYTLSDGYVCVHFPDSEKFKEQVKATRFGRFVAGTEFESYAVDNVFGDNHLAMVGKKASDAKYHCTIEFRGGIVSVWYFGDAHYFVSDKRPKGSERLFTVDYERMGEGKRLLMRNDKLLQLLRAAYNSDRMRFNTQETRNKFVEVFRQ